MIRKIKLGVLIFLFFALPALATEVKVYVIDTEHGWHGRDVVNIIKGLAPNAVVVPKYSALDSSLMDISWIAQAICEAVDKGAEIINLSLGTSWIAEILGYECPQVLKDAINYAVDRGVVVVAAAGNSSRPLPDYPGRLEGVVSVGALEYDPLTGEYKIADYSNAGDIYAPGRFEVVSGGKVTSINGTSFAAPYVTGLIARTMEEMGVSAREAKNIILATARENNNYVIGPMEIGGMYFVSPPKLEKEYIIREIPLEEEEPSFPPFGPFLDKRDEILPI